MREDMGRKLAFSTSQYSTPLNPDIRSGASGLPPFKMPQLRTAIQKNSGAVTPMVGPGNGDLTKAGMAVLLEEFDFRCKLAAMGVGQWWEQVGGPHLAKGGSHGDFKKMMETEGIPSQFQAKLTRMAEEKYKPGFNLGEAAKQVAGQHAQTQAPAGWLATPSPLRDVGLPLAVGLASYGIGRGVGHLIKKHQEKKQQKVAASAPTRGNFMMASDIPPFRAPRLDRAIQKNSGETSMPMQPVDNIRNPQPENTSKYAGKLVKLEGDAVIEVDENGKSKGEGNLLQKEQGKEKADAFMPDGVTFSANDFKRSKYAMPTSELARLVEELRKEGGGGLTPASQLSKTQSIGAPKASPPPGPSIAQIAKPRGARFGVGIPGAFKSTIGGDKGVALK